MDIIDIIKEKHCNDEQQIEAITTNEKRVMLVAPAGCGKTKTLISKISYVLCTNKEIKYSKKILALTFSVNAAFKMKKDVYSYCPNTLNLSIDFIKSKVVISNYHGFARSILAKYGYLLDERLKNINEIVPLDDKSVLGLPYLNLDEFDKKLLSEFYLQLNECNRNYIDSNIDRYYSVMIKLLDINVITYNSYLVYLIILFRKYNKLLNFYQNIFQILMIDEFQDTNYLSWLLINELVSNKCSLFFMGDKLQRIYGFIGAIPNLIDEAISKYSMKEIILKKNYRFKDNKEMLLLDNNIRKNSSEEFDEIIENAHIKLKINNTINDEINYAKKIINFVILKKCKLAILVQSRSCNLSKLLDDFDKTNIKYFYGLFTENDKEYIQFHIDCEKAFFELYNGERIGKSFLEKVCNQIILIYKNNNSPIVKSLIVLLKLFFDRINVDYPFLTNEEKCLLIGDTFTSRTLKQNMDLVDADVFISTIHSAKGLEWDYVYFPFCNDYVFPNYNSLCNFCNSIKKGYFCERNIPIENKKEYLEELSVFYVAVTRSKISISFSACRERINREGEVKKAYVSCLLSLIGIEIKFL